MNLRTAHVSGRIDMLLFKLIELSFQQKAKLSVLLDHVNKLLGIPQQRAKWTANGKFKLFSGVVATFIYCT